MLFEDTNGRPKRASLDCTLVRKGQFVELRESKKERDSAARRKRKKDPGQTKKRGAAKPTYVKTDPQKGGRKKKKKNEELQMNLEQIIREELETFLAEAVSKENEEELKKISDELKGASKMHAQQAAKIEKMIKSMKPKPKKKK